MLLHVHPVPCIEFSYKNNQENHFFNFLILESLFPGDSAPRLRVLSLLVPPEIFQY